FFQHRTALDGDESKPKFEHVFALGEPIEYEIRVTKTGLLSCTVNGETLSAQLDVSSYAGDTWYFKAGCYSQDLKTSTGTGQTTFTRLVAHHGTAEGLAEKLAAVEEPTPAEEPEEQPKQPVEEPSDEQPATEEPTVNEDDNITGTAEDDLLDGGQGKDRLSGGAGGDVFRFSARTDSYRTNSASFSDLITDFDPAQDALDL
ncbi:polysaccharide lyase family 7 protein, partial [Azorhizophilus paspali]